MFIYILLIVLLLMSIYTITVYNTILTTQIQVKEIWCSLETHLKQRHTLIPELITIIQKKDKLSKNTINIRNLAASVSGNTIRKEQYENMLSGTLKSLFDVLDHTEISKNSLYITQKQKIQESENKIQEICSNYNHSVAHFNHIICMFPNYLIIQHVHIEPERFFHFEPSDK